MIRLAAPLMALSLWAGPALAHKLKVFVTHEAGELVGTAYFAGGGPAVQVNGTVMAADGAELARFRTDAEGNFRVTAPADALVTVDSGDGHVASTGGATVEPVSTPATDVEAAVARQIRPLRLQLDAMEERARFSDIMGGIGTIFGVFGIAAWIAARRGGKP